MNITEFRQQYPQYSNWSDQELSDSLYDKYYKDMPREEFDSQFIGVKEPEPQKEPEFQREIKPEVNIQRLTEDEIPGGRKVVSGVNIFQEAGTGKLYGLTKEGYAALTTEEETSIKSSDEWNLTQWETEPWVDPTTVGLTAGGMATKLALKAGVPLVQALGKGLAAGAVSAVAEYPIGMATEKVGEKYPKLALPFNVLTGMVSGATIENAIEKGLVKYFGKAIPRSIIRSKISKVTKALESEDYTNPMVQKVVKEINEATKDIGTPEKLVKAVEPERADETLALVKKVAKTEDDQIKAIIDDSVKQHVDMAVMSKDKHPEISQASATRALENAEKLKMADGPKTEKMVDEVLKPLKIEPEITPVKERVSGKLAEQRGEITVKKGEAFEGQDVKVWKDIKESREISKQARKTTPTKLYKALKKATVDVSGNIKKDLLKQGPEGKKAVIRHDTIAGAHSEALRQINEANDAIYKGLNKVDHDYLDTYIYSKRHLEILKNKPDFKFPAGATKEDFQKAIDSIPKESLKRVEKRASKYWDVMNNQIRELHNEGLITKQDYDNLSKSGKYYSPRQVLEYVDPESTFNIGGKKITIPDSGIKRLEEGSLKHIESDTSLLMSQVIERTQTRIFKNRANKALYDLAKARPDNEIVKLPKVIRTTKEGKPVYQPTPRGYDKVSTIIDGKKVEMLMPTEMAEEWVKSDPILNHSVANFMSHITGTKLLKAMATGYNPEFALTNIPRDLAHIWLTTTEYSKHGPIATLQLSKDIIDVISDAIKRKGAYIDYIKQGGGMEFLTHQGRFQPTLKGVFGKIQGFMGYLGETSEIMTRLALRNRALKQGKSAEEATWIARNYMDFSQGGNVIKAIDSVVPYLNASIQGSRGIFRAAAKDPKVFTYKVAQIGTISTALYYLNKFYNPEAWDDTSERDKINNWIIPTPKSFSYTDEDGNKRYMQIKIAKDQGQRMFATLAESMAAKAIGEDVNVDMIIQSIKDAVPVMPDMLMPPALEAYFGYTANKDFWRNEDIWRGTPYGKIKPEEEYYKEYTPDFFIKTGKKTGMSPERLKYALSQFFTSGNVWTSLAGYGWDELLSDVPEKEREKFIQEQIINTPFARKLLKRTDPYHKYGKKIEEAGVEANTKSYIITRDFDSLVNKRFKDKATQKDIVDFIKKYPLEKDRLMSRYQKSLKLKKIPERRFWLNLMELPPEARASEFWNRWRDSSEEERKELNKISRKIPGFYSKKFVHKFGLLRRQNEKKEKE